MFRSTTHFKFWIFGDENELHRRRKEANQRFITNKISTMNVTPERFLTLSEETSLIDHYLKSLKDFCRRFNPPMPKYVISTAIQYLKRFYLNNSAMEHHPKHIIVTCAYLAAKIEEFNVSMDQFVNNIKGDRRKAEEIILQKELLLLHEINYQLIIWHPYRSIEGFLIDIKARFPQCRDPEKYRSEIDQFIDQCFSTDAFFLLCPNQIALLAIIYAAKKFDESLEQYLRILFNDNMEEVAFIQKWMIRINEMIRKIELPSKIYVSQIESKLEYFQSKTIKIKTKNIVDSEDEDNDDGDDRGAISYNRYLQVKEEQEQNETYLEQKSGTRSHHNRRDK